MSRGIPGLVLLAALAGCAEPTQLEAAWYLQDLHPGAREPSLLVAVRNRARHSEAISGFTIDPAGPQGGWRRATDLPKPVVLAPGQLLVLDLDDLTPSGDPWPRHWPWRQPADAGQPEGPSCTVPVRLTVRLADQRSQEVPVAGGMPNYLAAAWLRDCLVPRPPASAATD